MKATLTFNLPEEANEHRLALDGSGWYAVAWDMDNWLRNMLKYGNHGTESAEQALEKARAMLATFAEDRSLNLQDYP